MTPEQQHGDAQLLELWELVEELGDLSHRLCRAADAAMDALGNRPAPPPEEDRT